MKKASLVALTVLLASTAAFAETAGTAAPMLMGKIKSIAPAAMPMGLSSLTLIDQAGKEIPIKLSGKTTITNKAGKPESIANLAAGEMITVKLGPDQAANSVQIDG